MLKRINKDNPGIYVKSESVSRKILRRLRSQSKIRGGLCFYKSHKSMGLAKKLPQKWQWRWNRKSSNVWKQIRFLGKFNVSGLQVFKVRKDFRVKRVLDKLLMWRYRFNRKNLLFNLHLSTINRLDRILVVMGNARNITEARLKLRRGIVMVNGIVVFNYNIILSVNDIVQVRDNTQFAFIPLLRKLANNVNVRSLDV